MISSSDILHGKVLIVDDQETNVRLLARMLGSAGYTSVASTMDPLEVCELHRMHRYDLILLDLQMPGLDGFQVMEGLKAIETDGYLPVLVIAAQPDHKLRAFQAGAKDFVSKPFDLAEVLARVYNLLEVRLLHKELHNYNDVLEQQVQSRTADLQRFRAAMDAAADAIYLVDRASMGFVYVNDAACRMQSQTREELLALGPEAVLSTSRAELERTYDSVIANSVEAKPVEVLQDRRDGSRAWGELRHHAQRTGDRWTMVTMVRDVTERKRAEDRIVYLNRVYAVLSGINTLIVRVRDRDELFREACRIAVEVGGFRVAWIGVVDRSARKLVPVASAGADEEFLTTIKGLLSSGEGASNTMAARAIEEKKAVVSNDSQSDPRVLSHKKNAEGGIRSLAVFPLIVAEEAVGVIALYAGEIEFFHEEELKLLTELAGDIAFAIDHIDKQARLDYLAYYDALTGLANRGLFLERVAQSMRSAVGGEHKLALFLIDLERFKSINDSLGRPATRS